MPEAPSAQPPSKANAAALVLAGAWAVAGCLHLLSGAGNRAQNWSQGYLALLLLACASLARRAWQSPEPARRAWLLLTCGTLLDAGNLLRTVLQMHGFVPFHLPGPSNLLNLLTGTFLLAGILAFPKGPDRRGLGWRGALDGMLFAASLLFLLWVLGVRNSLGAAPDGVALRVFVAYLNVALLGGALVFMTGSRPEQIRGPLGWVAAAVLAWLAALALWTLAGLPAVVEDRAWIVLAGGTPVFLGIAAWSPARDQLPEAGANSEGDLYRRLPTLLVALGILVLACLLIWAPASVTRGTYAIFLAMVILLLLRMLQAIQELRAARATLEERVLERTRALELAQDTLLRAERMNALATLGAGVAHDLNNFLNVVHTSAELMQDDLDRGRPPTERGLRRILDASEQAGRLTRRLLAYGRKDPRPEGPSGDVAGTVAAMRELLRMLLPGNIGLSFELAAGDDRVRVESAVLEQVLVNLVSNAKDAMPGGGEVAIRLAQGQLTDGAPAILLEVSDTGPGIPEDLHEVIFEAFFTTKPEGRGTGLGLASVRTLMTAQGGTVSVASGPGPGTTFRLAFPLKP